MSSGSFQRAPVICALCLAAAASLIAAPLDPVQQQRLTKLFAELGEAEQNQDHPRLRTLYSEIATLQPGSPEVQRGLGLACYLQGEFEAAIAALERAASLQSELAGVRLYLGISYYRTNRFSAALVELERAPELRADDPMARYWQGAAYRALGRLSSAIAALEIARAKADANQDVHQLLTRSYAEYSAEWFRQLLSVAAASPAARLLKAEELARDGVQHAALQELDIALEAAPRLIGLHRMKGQVLWSQEEYEQGIEEFKLELENDPFSVEANLRLGAFFLDGGNPSAALQHLRLARRYGPVDGRVGELLDRALRAAGNAHSPVGSAGGSSLVANPSLEDARDAYRSGDAHRAALLVERLTGEQSESMEARRLLIRCYLAAGDIRKAVEQLHKILETMQDDPETLYLLGKGYERLASQAAERLFELNPSSSSIRLLRGESFERGPRYEFEKALAEFREAAALSPADPGVQHAIGRVLFKMKRFDEAVPHLQRALGQNRGHAMAHYLLGKIRLLLGDRPGAIESLLAAVEARTGLTDAQRDLARAMVLEGRYDEGIKIYETLVERNMADSSLHALLAVAYRMAGRMQDAKAHAEKARTLGNAKHQPDEP